MLPANIGDIEVLNLGNNGLEEVPDGLGSALGSLRVLVLRGTARPATSSAVAELGHHLTDADVSHNRLSVLGPEAVGALRELRSSTSATTSSPPCQPSWVRGPPGRAGRQLQPAGRTARPPASLACAPT